MPLRMEQGCCFLQKYRPQMAGYFNERYSYIRTRNVQEGTFPKESTRRLLCLLPARPIRLDYSDACAEFEPIESIGSQRAWIRAGHKRDLDVHTPQASWWTQR